MPWRSRKDEEDNDERDIGNKAHFECNCEESQNQNKNPNKNPNENENIY
jgi:hypothetical protein